jgi:hypothetical protein
MKNYYEELKQFYKDTNNTERLAKLEKFKADNKEVEIIKLYNDYRAYKKSGLKESKDKFTKSKLKQYIKEVIIETLSESTIDTSNPNTLSLSDKQNLINTARIKTKNPKLGTSLDPVDFVESELTELEPNSKQKLKLANRELAFLEKKVRSLEKQLKSQGSDENAG